MECGGQADRTPEIDLLWKAESTFSGALHG